MKYLSVLFLLSFLILFDSEAQQLTWMQTPNSIPTDFSFAVDVKTDAAGNVYTCGSFAGTMTMGSYTITSTGGTDIYISKHDANGVCQWLQQSTGASQEEARSIEVSPSGEVFVTGELWIGGGVANAFFGSTSITVQEDYTYPYLTKLSTNGVFQWAKAGISSAPSPDAVGYDIALDANQNVYLAGMFNNNISFDSISETGFAYEGFVAKFLPDGQPLWIRKTSGNLRLDQAVGVEVSGNGSIYLIGNKFVSASISALHCLDPQGTILWSKNLGTLPGYTNPVRALGIRKDASNNLLLHGNFKGTFTIDSTTISNNTGIENAFIAKIDANGNLLWLIKSLSGNGFNINIDLAVLPGGGLVEIGHFMQDVTVGATTYTSKGNADVYFTQRDQNGQIVSFFTFGGWDDDLGYGIAVGANNELYLSGAAKRNVTILNQTFTFGTNNTLYIAQLNGFILLEKPKEIPELIFSPHPNPTSSSLTFTYPLLQHTANLTLTDALGRRVFQQTLPQGSTQLTADLSQLPEAVYFYQLAAESGSIGSGKVAVAR